MRFAAVFMVVLVISLPFVFATELSYDANGNLISGDGKFRVYNGFNQLFRIYNGSSEEGVLLQEFHHHPVEERIYEKITFNSDGSVKERVIYFTSTDVKVVNASGEFDYTYVMHNGQKVAEIVNGEKKFFHSDHLGSTSVVTDDTGNVVEQTVYSPYGEIVSGGSSRFDYEGKEFDSVSGQYDFHFRGYRPDWGIFTQPDSLLPNVYDPQQLNRYMFERGNPYKFTDQSGHCIWDACVLEIITASIVVVGLAIYLVDAIDYVKTPAEETTDEDAVNFLVSSGVNLIPGGTLQQAGITVVDTSTGGSRKVSKFIVENFMVQESPEVKLDLRPVHYMDEEGNTKTMSVPTNVHKVIEFRSGNSGRVRKVSKNIKWYFNAKKKSIQYWVGDGKPSDEDYVYVGTEEEVMEVLNGEK